MQYYIGEFSIGYAYLFLNITRYVYIFFVDRQHCLITLVNKMNLRKIREDKDRSKKLILNFSLKLKCLHKIVDVVSV